MIRSFRSRDTERLFRRQPIRTLAADLQRVALRKLILLDAGTSLVDLRTPPANRIEKLVGSRAGQYSIRINDHWRVCFRWTGSDAEDVEIVDYH